MRSLIENVFRKQLKRLRNKIGYDVRVVISFNTSGDTFNYDVSILTGDDVGNQVMDNITEENIKRIVDRLIDRYENRHEERESNHDEIRMSDFVEPDIAGYNRIYNGNIFNMRECNREIRDTGETVEEVLSGRYSNVQS